jgi:DNA-binding SARP family transcriptional activator/tetratricopeptide (TPR) repeat protein
MDHDLLARTKVMPALRRTDTLERPRLLEWLSTQTQRPLSLIVADAGYGKTTLLADFSSRSPVTCLWFRVEEHEGDLVSFISYVIAAIREAVPDFGEATRALLAQLLTSDPSRASVLDTLVAELAGLTDLRAIFIVDDFHLVDQADDAGEVMVRLISAAPPGITFVIATRRWPKLSLGRLLAQGDAGILTSENLRFSAEETCDLFGGVYGQQLEVDVLEQIDRKTEGWAVSLQLLGSSIRGRSNVEIRNLVHSLSGAHGALFDYLAEEVLAGLSPDLRRFVVAASILQRITPRYVVALFETDETPPDEAQAATWIADVDELGLISRRGTTVGGHSFHPLLREFLLRHLRQEAPSQAIRDTHRRVGRVAESSAWPVSCHHYLEAGETKDAMRVLTDSLLTAAGTGDWGLASSLLDRMPEEPTDPAAQVIIALQEMNQQRTVEALERLRAIPAADADPRMRSMVRYALTRGTWLAGDASRSLEMLRELTRDPETPELLRAMAEIQEKLVTPGGRQYLPEIEALVQALAKRLRTVKLHYFLGVCLHNAMVVAHFRCDYPTAARLGADAIQELELSGRGASECSETAGFLAATHVEMGQYQTASDYLEMALESSDNVEALVGAADLLVSLGRVQEGRVALTRAHAAHAHLPPSPAVRLDAVMVELRLRLASGDGSGAAHIGTSPDLGPIGLSAGVKALTLAAAAAVAAGRHDAPLLAVRALHAAEADGASHWATRSRIIWAAGAGSEADLRAAITGGARVGTLAVADVAEVLAAVLDRLDPIPSEIEESISLWPNRWLPVLRRQLEAGFDRRSLAAARLLSRHGTVLDVPRLRVWERRHVRRGNALHLGRQLALRTSPKLRIHDLGTSRMSIGDRHVGLSDIRRRAAMLLMYLVARKDRAVLREQVFEDLWPDLDAAAAANSLNQTLYFVRRDIEPGFDEAVSVNYVLYEGEMLRLEPELVEVDSWSFQRRASRTERRAASVYELLALLEEYSGTFSPEFAYEDWAIEWREQVHTTYLDLVAYAQTRLRELGWLDEAIAVTQRALAVDPKAIDLERSLVWLYGATGSGAAAAEQYRHYASACEAELGIEPETFADVVAGACVTDQ